MRAKIGARLLNDLLSGEIEFRTKPYDIWDTETKGFLLRVRPSSTGVGVLAYYVSYRRPDNRKTRFLLGHTTTLTPAQARDLAKMTLGDLARGIDPMVEKKVRSTPNLKTYLKEKYSPWATANLKSGAQTVASLESTYSDFLNRRLNEISPWLIEKWRTERLKDGTSPSTVNRNLGSLKSALTRAVQWEILTDNPISKVKLCKVDRRGVVRYLTDDEEQALRDALDLREERMRKGRRSANEWRAERNYPLFANLDFSPFADYLKPMVLLAINTGVRQGELFGLTVECVNLTVNSISIEGSKAKSGKTRHIPLNLEAQNILKDWLSHRGNPKSGLVFPNYDGKQFDNVKRSWAAVLKEAKIETFRWHDMRHHFASRLVMVGVDLNTVRELLGHSSLEMTLRYAHLSPEIKAEAVSRLERRT